MKEELGNLEKILVFGDPHIPFQDDRAVDCMIKYAKREYKPSIIVINGDMLDFYSISTFDKNPSRKETIQDELDTANAFLSDLRSYFPKAKIYYLEGNHESVHKNTDILTITGWKKVTEVTKDDYVGQFNIDDNEITFAKPLELIEHFSEELIDIESNNSHQCVTLNHDVVINDTKIKAKELLNDKYSQINIPVFGNYNSNGIKLSNDWIKLLTWVVMDGTIVDDRKYNENSIKRRIQFKLSKKEKINSLKNLLNNMNIKYTFKECKKSKFNKLQPYYIRIYGDDARSIFNLLNDKKELPKEWAFMNRSQLNVFLKTLIKTDGCRVYNHINWFTTNKHNLNIVQQTCLQNNINCYYTEKCDRSGFENGKLQYIVSIFDKGLMNNKLSVNKISYNDKSYCFTMPKGTLITRFEGKPAFTGNCRFQKLLWHNPEISSLRSLRLENQLDLKYNNITFIGTSPDYWKKDSGHLKIGDMLIMHGDNRLNGASTSKYSCYSVKNTVSTMQCNVTMGHVHRLGKYYQSTPFNILKGIEGGCLCQISGTANWQQGFVTFEEDKGKTFNHRLYNINNGVLYVDGKKYTSRKKIKNPI